MAAGPRPAGRGRCGRTGAPHPGGPAAAGREEERSGRAGPRSELHRPVQPAGGSLPAPCWETTRIVVQLIRAELQAGLCFARQIVKILTLYTPQSDLEERVSLNFIRTVQVPCYHTHFLPYSLIAFLPCSLPALLPYSLPALHFFGIVLCRKAVSNSAVALLGAFERPLRGSDPPAAHGCEASVPGHVSLLASRRPPRRAVSHPRVPQDLLPPQSLSRRRVAPPQRRRDSSEAIINSFLFSFIFLLEAETQ